MSLNGNLNKSQFMEELQQKVEHINNVLEKFLPAEDGQQRIIFEAMNYSVRAGGKRLRPMLMEETYHMFGGSSAVIEPFMAAIEMIHTYSLVHDDLPAMDNDEYRRGKKTTHAVYGEAMGILAGDALLNLAYETAAKAFDMEVADARVARAFTVLAKRQACMVWSEDRWSMWKARNPMTVLSQGKSLTLSTGLRPAHL